MPTSSTVRTEAELLETFRDGQPTNSITAGDCRDLISSVGIAAAQLQSFDSQVASIINTLTVVAFESQHYVRNIGHSATINNSEITVQTSGVYEIMVGASFYKTGGGTATTTLALQESIGGSPEWFTTSAAVRRDVSGNGIAGFASFGHIDAHNAGDKYRVVWFTDNLEATLESFDATGGSPATHIAGHPRVPSVDLRIQRVGWL